MCAWESVPPRSGMALVVVRALLEVRRRGVAFSGFGATELSAKRSRQSHTLS